jgi:hypothetical protein
MVEWLCSFAVSRGKELNDGTGMRVSKSSRSSFIIFFSKKAEAQNPGK